LPRARSPQETGPGPPVSHGHHGRRHHPRVLGPRGPGGLRHALALRVAAGGQAAPRAASGLAAFLRTELAPTPGRARDAMRITAACLAATVVVMGLHVPYGDWIVWSIVQVSGEDTGASLIKAAQRIAATLVGGLTGLLIGIAFADEPQFMFPTIGLVV